jgi:hypothetical protein
LAGEEIVILEGRKPAENAEINLAEESSEKCRPSASPEKKSHRDLSRELSSRDAQREVSKHSSSSNNGGVSNKSRERERYEKKTYQKFQRPAIDKS